jgi:hypothetical protein
LGQLGRVCIAALALSAALFPRSGNAQSLPDSLVGRRVLIRLTKQPLKVEGAGAPTFLRGTLVASRSDSMTLRPHPQSGPLTVATPAIERVYLSLGVPGRLESAGRQGLGFAIFGAAEWSLLNATSAHKPFDPAWQAAVGGAAAGAAIGGLLGAIFPRERWKQLEWR